MRGQNVSVNITEPNGNRCRVLDARETSVRERVISFLFGKKMKMLILTPGNSVSQITINESKGGYSNDNNGRFIGDC